MLNRRQVALGSLATLVAATARAGAQSWPNRPIRFVVPLAAGGGVDMMARIFADSLGQALGERIIVENQGGASLSLWPEAHHSRGKNWGQRRAHESADSRPLAPIAPKIRATMSAPLASHSWPE